MCAHRKWRFQLREIFAEWCIGQKSVNFIPTRLLEIKKGSKSNEHNISRKQWMLLCNLISSRFFSDVLSVCIKDLISIHSFTKISVSSYLGTEALVWSSIFSSCGQDGYVLFNNDPYFYVASGGINYFRKASQMRFNNDSVFQRLVYFHADEGRLLAQWLLPRPVYLGTFVSEKTELKLCFGQRKMEIS